jgi:transketolase
MKRLAAAIADALSQATRDRDDLWVLDGDLGDSYGLYDEAHQPRFDRFLQVGIAEQTLVGAAAGLAAAGKSPWVFSFSAFLCHRASDQIRTCVAQPKLPVVLVGSHAGASAGANGSSHASLDDLGMLAAMGGIELWAPADAADVAAAVGSLLAHPRPAYLRTSREPVWDLPLDAGTIRSNGAGGRVVLLSTGLASHWASEVVRSFGKRGITLPWSHTARIDDAVLLDWIGTHAGMTDAVVLEDHGVVGGLADAVRRAAGTTIAVHGIGWPRHWHGESGSLDDLRRECGLDAQAIVRFIETLL